MPDGVIIELSGDERKLLDAFRRSVAAADKLPESLDKGAKAGERVDKEIVKLANHVKDIQTQPIERLAQAEEKLNQAVGKGLLSKEQAATHLATLRGGMEKTASASTSLAGTMISGAATMAASFVSVGAVIGYVQSSLQEFQADQEKALQIQAKLVEGNQKLRQVSGTNQEFKRLEQASLDLSSRAPIPLEEASELMFMAKSYGIEDPQLLTRLGYADKFVGDARMLLGMGGAIEKNTKGTSEESSALQGVNMLLEASQATEADITLLDPHAKAAMQSFTPAGLKGSEAVSAVASVYSLFGESTGSRLRAFGQQVGMNDTFKGQSLPDVIRMIDADEGLEKETFGGNQEALGAYSKLSKELQLGNLDANIARAVRGREMTGTNQDALGIRNAQSLELPEKLAEAKSQIYQNLADIEDYKGRENANDVKAGGNLLESSLKANEVPYLARPLARARYYMMRNDDNEIETARMVAKENSRVVGGGLFGAPEFSNPIDAMLKPSADAMAETLKLQTAAANFAADKMAAAAGHLERAHANHAEQARAQMNQQQQN